MNIAIIPARGGSKRIPRKNIKLFCGKPMIAWSIEVAKASECFDRIIVSTDDPEISEVAKQWGAEVPFLRPAELADDHTGTTAVIAHAIGWLALQGNTPDKVCCIYATAPFLKADDLGRGLAALDDIGCDYAFSVTSYPFPIQRAIRIAASNRVEMFSPEHFNTRSQDLEEAYHDAGQFYWGNADAWIQNKVIFGSASAPIKLPRLRVQDIDTPEDWEQAELMFRLLHELSKTGTQNEATPVEILNFIDVEPDEPIYRIIPLIRFIEMLDKQEFVMTHPSVWDDPQENSILSAKLVCDNELGDFTRIRSKVFGQSWSLVDETDAMWRIYSPDKKSVRIKTTPRKLLNALCGAKKDNSNIHCFIGKVKYKKSIEIWDEFSKFEDFLTSDGVGIAKTLLFKRIEFEAEKEVRLIFTDGPDKLFCPIKVADRSLIDEVTLDPRTSDVELAKLTSQARQLGYLGIVKKSNLYEVPQEKIFTLN